MRIRIRLRIRLRMRIRIRMIIWDNHYAKPAGADLEPDPTVSSAVGLHS